MEGADLCCGMGGSFRIFHPRVSRTISRKKLSAIEESQADVIATTCMGCWLQLNEMVQTRHVRKSVVHLAELLWDELKQESE
jgi:glycolate oxidase iron-sulfur subunit